MTIEADLYTILTGSTSVTALSSNRIYPMMLPQKCTYPAISYFRVSTVPNHLFSVDAANVQARFQVDCWDDDALGSRALANAVSTALNRIGRSTSRTVVMEDIFFDNQQDLPERDLDEDVFRVSMDFLVYYLES